APTGGRLAALVTPQIVSRLLALAITSKVIDTAHTSQHSGRKPEQRGSPTCLASMPVGGISILGTTTMRIGRTRRRPRGSRTDRMSTDERALTGVTRSRH